MTKLVSQDSCPADVSSAVVNQAQLAPAAEPHCDIAWHALYTRHQHEKIAAHILTEKGFEVFLPLYSTVHRWKDRAKKLSLPLFPGYVFFQGGLERRHDIVSTMGVHSLVCVGTQVAVISDQEIHAVRRAADACTATEPHPFLRNGDRVRVTSGPLHGVEGILIRKKDGLRLILSINLLQRSIAVEVDALAVAPVSNPLPARLEPRGEASGRATN